MSKFTRFSSTLDLRYHFEGAWEVLTELKYDVAYLGSGITVTVPVGFVTDGGSIPKIVWGIISPWEEDCGKAFVIHDFLCVNKYLEFRQDSGKVERIPVSRKRVDEILEEALKVLDITPWKRDAIVRAVTLYRVANRL